MKIYEIHIFLKERCNAEGDETTVDERVIASTDYGLMSDILDVIEHYDIDYQWYEKEV